MLHSFVLLQRHTDALIALCATTRAFDAVAQSVRALVPSLLHTIGASQEKLVLVDVMRVTHAAMAAMQRPSPARRRQWRLHSQNSSVTALVPIGAQLLSGGNRGCIERWNLIDGTCTLRWRGALR